MRGEETAGSNAPAGAEPTDADLWVRLRAGDEYAFRTLFGRHNKAVYNFAFRHSASWSMAEDVTQATFTTLWRRACEGTVDDLHLESARPVLLSMARNEASNALRSAKRHLRLVDRVESVTPKGTDNTERWLAEEKEMGHINDVLGRIPDNQRAVIELVAWAGLEMSEVAQVLGVPVGTVKSRLNRARSKLATTEIAQLLGGVG
ncbi:RNA polymerase sigma factor [Naumannella cuiyingiana]|uniref:RNA polymerase sigma-70 factor (ECF subfamily) n=1 Tax=Naumannella cuiyingiana TaxID=1347891 RepID=A0A7Z0D995_9ACTN|nr:RNA polymerase sigma-70 factor (ECF subfamily) [Naumannella cuiyingiana]